MKKVLAAMLVVWLTAALFQVAGAGRDQTLELGVGYEPALAYGGSTSADFVFPGGVIIDGRFAGPRIALRGLIFTSNLSAFAGLETSGPFLFGAMFGYTLETGTAWGDIHAGFRITLGPIKLLLSAYYRMTVNKGLAGSMNQWGPRFGLGLQF